MVYKGEKLVNYVGIIKKGNQGQDIRLENEEEKGKTLLAFLKGKIKAVYNLPGEVSVERDTGELLTDDMAHLGDIIKPNAKTLVFRYDASISVAGGGFGTGGEASGPSAEASGGYGEGGVIDKHGAEAGDGKGGNAKGEAARAGLGKGGVANIHGGGRRIAEAGQGLGGKAYES